RVASCSKCSNDQKMGFVGSGSTLTFNNVTVSAAGSYQLTIVYCDRSTTDRQAVMSVNGSTGQTLSFTPTDSFNTPNTMIMTITLNTNSNTIQFSNPATYAPDFDKISLARSTTTTSIKAESSNNTLASSAKMASCSKYSNGQ